LRDEKERTAGYFFFKNLPLRTEISILYPPTQLFSLLFFLSGWRIHELKTTTTTAVEKERAATGQYYPAV
jgi:hypothetical protein